MKITLFACVLACALGALAEAPIVGLTTMVTDAAATAATRGAPHRRALRNRPLTEPPVAT
ncbi:hypothetical protein O3X23_16955 [Streptomyces sp. H39-S7]|nr:hypothetical protein [Streptomyces sp. H39-S7]